MSRSDKMAESLVKRKWLVTAGQFDSDVIQLKRDGQYPKKKQWAGLANVPSETKYIPMPDGTSGNRPGSFHQ